MRKGGFMSKLKTIFFLTILFISSNSYALMEMGVDYSYSRKVYGSNRENNTKSTTYSGSWAIYFLTLTALELSFGQTEETTVEKSSIAIDGSTITVTGFKTIVDSKMFGIGIKQALGPKKARLRPAISIGYARQFVEDKTFINYSDSASGISGSLQDSESSARYDSVQASFSLQFFLSQRFSLKGSVRTIFPAFDFDKASDDLRYSIGLSWFL